MQCWQCNFIQENNNGWFCQKCKINLYAGCKEDTKRRRPLTDHEKLKLSWYRDESKWIENIRSRKTVIVDGKPLAVSNTGIMPRQPAQYYKNGGRVK